ncbi:hypothetical protein [Tolypothrix sp. NIES-4075]|uniref:hypothetical protein n=1 Tax=Tolypothrix sp. NIES-4075 TaxID=2005459 RepID=UPI00135B196F|nr:hypothetical protein [Tolypothrix sp. NIES-4075]
MDFNTIPYSYFTIINQVKVKISALMLCTLDYQVFSDWVRHKRSLTGNNVVILCRVEQL